MTKAEQFIKDYTRNCSNQLYYHNQRYTNGTAIDNGGIEVTYSPWLSPEQALRATEIAVEEYKEEQRNHPFATFTIEEFDAEKEKVEKKVVNKACTFIRENLDRYDESIGWSKDEFIENFLKDMEG